MQELSIQEIRDIQINILNVFAEYCEKSKLNYFLCGGTLIGAVRHKGYIPWDDDIDVAMLRGDYEKLIESFNGFNSLYKLYNSNEMGKFPFPFSKISYEASLLKENTDEKNTYNIGINIDVFPIDTIPEDGKLQKKILGKISFQRKILNAKLIKHNRNRSIIKSSILSVGKLVFSFKSIPNVVKKINDLAISNYSFNSNKLGIIVWGYGESEIVSNEVFESIVKKEFEGNYYNVPAGYHKWLSSIYGDYMKFPPLEKQVTHHDFKAFLK
ncbi:LicD family protein [Paenibacillus piscarius]|uniref:LicD family protein n=1 Tax=Paenibacillus piscarius TaxID=1089681 RepID=UPI001EE78542|nr:LicD family protein [Paenibacillus piscarius]